MVKRGVVEVSIPDGRVYPINMCHSSSSFFSHRLPPIYVPLKGVWMCIRIGMDIISCSLFHRSLIRLFEWDSELVWHGSRANWFESGYDLVTELFRCATISIVDRRDKDFLKAKECFGGSGPPESQLLRQQSRGFD